MFPQDRPAGWRLRDSVNAAFSLKKATLSRKLFCYFQGKLAPGILLKKACPGKEQH